jgi:hypothetical protein
MAKIKFTEKAKGVEAEYAGKTHTIEFYPGDTRPLAVKVEACKDWLAFNVKREFPEAEK